MPEFISLLRWIRDTAYVEIKTAYDTYLTISVGSTTNIDPVNGTVQPATVAYNPLTGELDFGIPESQGIETVTATNIPAISGVVQPATVSLDYATNELSLGIPINDVVDNTDASLLRADGSVEMNAGYVPAVALGLATKEYVDEATDSINGTIVIANSATEVTTALTTMTKVKEIRAGRNGSARLAFELKTTKDTETATGQIYKNGTPIGTLQTTLLLTYETYVQNFTVERGDLIQLYIKSTGLSGATAVVQNLEYKVENPLVATVTL